MDLINDIWKHQISHGHFPSMSESTFRWYVRGSVESIVELTRGNLVGRVYYLFLHVVYFSGRFFPNCPLKTGYLILERNSR